RSRTGPVFVVVELAEEISGRSAGETGNVAIAFQTGSVTCIARRCRTGCCTRELSALLDASGRHIGSERHASVAADESLRVITELDNALADRLRAAAGVDYEVPRCHNGLRNGFSFFHTNDRSRLHGGKVRRRG